MSELVWKEPPESRAMRWEPVIAELQANPGRWALVKTYPKQTTAATMGCILKKRYAVEYRTRTTPEGGELYLRYP